MPAFILLVLILLVVLWYICTSLFGKQIYNAARKIYQDLTKEEPIDISVDETKGEKKKL